MPSRRSKSLLQFDHVWLLLLQVRQDWRDHKATKNIRVDGIPYQAKSWRLLRCQHQLRDQRKASESCEQSLFKVCLHLTWVDQSTGVPASERHYWEVWLRHHRKSPRCLGHLGKLNQEVMYANPYQRQHNSPPWPWRWYHVRWPRSRGQRILRKLQRDREDDVCCLKACWHRVQEASRWVGCQVP